MTSAKDDSEKTLLPRKEFREGVAITFAWIIVVGVVIEIAKTFPLLQPTWAAAWLSLRENIGSLLVVIGVGGEIIFEGSAGKISEVMRNMSNDKVAMANDRASAADQKAAEANERAAKADLARAELEANLQPRMTDERQISLIQTLQGKIEQISIIHEVVLRCFAWVETVQAGNARSSLPASR